MKKIVITFLLLFAVFGQQAWAAKTLDFKLVDNNGKAHRLSDYRGKWVLVNFWAPWCPRCRAEFPLLNDLDTNNDVVVLGVAMDYGTDRGSVLTSISRHNLRYPNVLAGERGDANSPAQQIGPVDFYPTSYLYAPDGELVMFIPGVVSKNKLTAFMDGYASSAPTALAMATPAPSAQQSTVWKAKSAPVKAVTLRKKVGQASKKELVSRY